MKNLKKQVVYHLAQVFRKKFDVTDSLHPMKWTLTKEKKEILGYKCKSVTTTFRGRSYTVYYAPKIPVSNEPWKFGGLPGLILEVKTDEKEFCFSATQIATSSNHKLDYSIPAENKFISWDSYTKKFEEVVKAHINKLKANMKPGERGSIYLGKREMIYPPVQTGKGIEF